MRPKLVLAMLAVVSAAFLAAERPAHAQEPQAGPVLSIVAFLEPCLTIELSDNAINFHADQGPGVYDADREIDVSVATNYGSWSVNCTASSLVGTDGEISPARIFTSSNQTLSTADEGAGLTYQSMGSQKLVASGGPQPLTVVNTMRFRLLTEWTDRPGQYTGTVHFTYLATP